MKSFFQKLVAGYDGESEARLPEYLGALVLYNLLLSFYLRRSSKLERGRTEIDLKELFFFGVATHKLSRLITKDSVTSPLRAPFTKIQYALGYGEFQETARREGVAGAIGDVLSCNYCADPWVALALGFGMNYVPNLTRSLMKLMSGIAIADFLHVFYEEVRTQENVLTLREEILEKKTA